MIDAVRSIPKLVKLGIVGLVLVDLNGTVTQAQRAEQPDASIDLLSLGCSKSGDGTLITNNKDNVSVGKQIFTPIFYFGNIDYGDSPTLLTCKLEPSEQPKTLQLMVGIKDYATKTGHEIIFNAYLEGQQTASHSLTAGQGKTLLLDVTKTGNVALEAICSYRESGRRCPVLYFFKASVLPSPASSVPNSNPTAFTERQNTDPFNSNSQPAEPPLEESSWGNSTVGKDENAPVTGRSPEETIETIENIINIFK